MRVSPRNQLAGEGFKLPSAAVVKSCGSEQRRKRLGSKSSQVTPGRRTKVNHGFSCRKHQTISKPWFVRRLSFRRNRLKGGTVSGIYVKEKWMRLYIERWLNAPAQVEEGVY
jgi:hypothetical protein